MRSCKLCHWLPDLQKAVKLEQFNFYAFHSKLYFTVPRKLVIKELNLKQMSGITCVYYNSYLFFSLALILLFARKTNDCEICFKPLQRKS